jgi:putative methyltransferase (TIGR04325 family)
MRQLAALHNFVDTLASSPVVKGVLERRYERTFIDNRDANLFRGVFESFDAALKSAPPARPLGYDNAEAASMYVDRTRKIYPTDYPVIYWLQKLFGDGCKSVFDVGGHIGVSYYSYRRYISYPQGLSWTVHDVPAVMEAGRKFAEGKDQERRLSFCEKFEGVDGKDILFALGSLQYLEETLAQRLARLTHPPRHLILNLTPLHNKHSYFTLQSIGTAFCPYRVTSVGDFLKGIDVLGYKLVDQWENPEKKCEIPFHPEYSLDHYHGFYFRRDE